MLWCVCVGERERIKDEYQQMSQNDIMMRFATKCHRLLNREKKLRFKKKKKEKTDRCFESSHHDCRPFKIFKIWVGCVLFNGIKLERKSAKINELHGGKQPLIVK